VYHIQELMRYDGFCKGAESERRRHHHATINDILTCLNPLYSPGRFLIMRTQ
jgi:hypothetical protein